MEREMNYREGEIYGRGVFWVWSSIAYECDYPCYIDRCARTGVLLIPNPPPSSVPENTPRAIDGLEFV